MNIDEKRQELKNAKTVGGSRFLTDEEVENMNDQQIKDTWSAIAFDGSLSDIFNDLEIDPPRLFKLPSKSYPYTWLYLGIGLMAASLIGLILISG